jgi:hypothetical protein
MTRIGKLSSTRLWFRKNAAHLAGREAGGVPKGRITLSSYEIQFGGIEINA